MNNLNWKPGKKVGHPLSPKAREAVIRNFKILRLKGVIATLKQCTLISDNHAIFRFIDSEIKRLRK